jgi:hypothetical protein
VKEEEMEEENSEPNPSSETSTFSSVPLQIRKEGKNNQEINQILAKK